MGLATTDRRDGSRDVVLFGDIRGYALSLQGNPRVHRRCGAAASLRYDRCVEGSGDALRQASRLTDRGALWTLYVTGIEES